MNQENTPFLSLREIAKGINSPEDANAKLFDAISYMSQINELYIGVSLQRDKILSQLQEAAENAKKQQILCEESLHQCQLIADQNLSEVPPIVEMKDLCLPDAKTFQQELGISEEEFSQLSENEQIFKRMEHEIQKIPKIKEDFNNACAERSELSGQLDDARRRYAPIISKMQKMYDEITGFINCIQST